MIIATIEADKMRAKETIADLENLYYMEEEECDVLQKLIIAGVPVIIVNDWDTLEFMAISLGKEIVVDE